MAKYIFLDIDGVLNSRRTRARAPYECKGIGKKHLDILKEIANKTNGQIVLVSDWRLSFLPGDHMPDMADYITEKMHEAGLSFDLVSKNHRYENRAEEIMLWLDEHPAEGYIILDDDEYSYKEESIHSHHIQPENQKGLTKEHIQEAIYKISLPVTKSDKYRGENI